MVGKISRRDFLKLIYVAGGAIMFTPFLKLGKVFGANVTNTNTTDIHETSGKIGLTLNFLLVTKPTESHAI